MTFSFEGDSFPPLTLREPEFLRTGLPESGEPVAIDVGILEGEYNVRVASGDGLRSRILPFALAPAA